MWAAVGAGLLLGPPLSDRRDLALGPWWAVMLAAAWAGATVVGVRGGAVRPARLALSAVAFPAGVVLATAIVAVLARVMTPAGGGACVAEAPWGRAAQAATALLVLSALGAWLRTGQRAIEMGLGALASPVVLFGWRTLAAGVDGPSPLGSGVAAAAMTATLAWGALARWPNGGPRSDLVVRTLGASLALVLIGAAVRTGLPAFALGGIPCSEVAVLSLGAVPAMTPIVDPLRGAGDGPVPFRTGQWMLWATAGLAIGCWSLARG